MKGIKRIFAMAAAFLLLSTGTAASAVGRTYIDNTVQKGGGASTQLILAAVVLVFVFSAMVWVVRRGRSGRINVGWAVLAVVLAGLTMLLCIVGYSSGTLYTKPDGDPTDTVRTFYDSVIAGDYSTAYACLSDYASLGLETAPESENAVKAYEALKKSYDYSISGAAEINGLEAVVHVRFRYLDMPSFEKSVASRAVDNLEETVKNSPISQVYDENDNYLPHVTEKAYAEALDFILNKADTYYSSKVLDIKLRYSSGSWLMQTDETMLSCLMGGTMY